MNKFLSKILLLFAPFAISLLTPSSAQAVCPVCTVAVGAGLGISRWLGIDDVIVSLWIGAVVTSSGMMLASWVKSKGYKSWLCVASSFIFHLLTIITLLALGIAGDPLNRLWGFDKMLLGLVIGSIVFFIAALSDRAIKAANNNKVLIYYQKVILPMLFLSIVSYIFHLITS